MFLYNFRQFLENWIFEGISTGADLTKMVKIKTILNCAKIIFFVKIIFSTHQRTLQKWWKFELSWIVLRKYCRIEVFLHNFRQFLENWIFEGISTGADLTKMVKIWTILNCAMKILLGKIICSTHQRKCFSTILGNFWKIEFLKEYRQAWTLQKGWKFELS